MCVKIVKEDIEVSYNPGMPLEEQILGSNEVRINYKPFDRSIDRFLEEMQRFAQYGIATNLTIKVIHNDNISGFKIKQSLKKAINDITLNEIIKVMVLSHTEMDQKLSELANCFVSARK